MHYLREERPPETSPNLYHSELSPEVARMAHENVHEYLDKELEQSAESTRMDPEIEADALETETLPETWIELTAATQTDEIESLFEPTLEAAEPALEKTTENLLPTIENRPEIFEYYEPVKNLELLLVELDAYPLETNIEVKQEAEKVENAERSL
jgi:hypothetical protein